MKLFNLLLIGLIILNLWFGITFILQKQFVDAGINLGTVAITIIVVLKMHFWVDGAWRKKMIKSTSFYPSPKTNLKKELK